MTEFQDISSHLFVKIKNALARSGRATDAVELIAVSKTVPVELMREAVECGFRLFGENRVQELLAKQPLLPASLRWHLIGHLQSNKIRKVLPVVEVIHSVDSIELARDINRISADLGLFPKVLLEVNVAGEASKFGFTPESVGSQLEDLLALDRLEIQGLMCVPPPVEKPEESRPFFVKLREVRDRLEQQAGTKFPALSMGMSGDYEIAIEEGSTYVRIGSALFGSRKTK
jgi:PLP dependent protein